MSDPEKERFYGTDTTDKWWTLAEGTMDDDGTIHIDVVQIERGEVES